MNRISLFRFKIETWSQVFVFCFLGGRPVYVCRDADPGTLDSKWAETHDVLTVGNIPCDTFIQLIRIQSIFSSRY